MQLTENTKDNISAYQYILDNYHLDTYWNILENFADEYEMVLTDIQELMPYEFYMNVVKESNHNDEDIINNIHKFISKRLFLSDYDVFQPKGKITI